MMYPKIRYMMPYVKFTLTQCKLNIKERLN